MANALLGNFSSGSTGNVANVAATAAAAFAAPAAAETVGLNITGAGRTCTQGAISVSLATTDTETTALAKINTAIAGNATLAATGIKAQDNGSGSIQFVSKAGQSFQVAASSDTSNALGFGTYGASGTSVTAAAAGTVTVTQGFQFSLNGGASISIAPLAGTGAEATDLSTLNAAFSANAALNAAGITAVDNGAGKIKIESVSGTRFRMNTVGGTGNAFGFGASTGVASTGSIASAYAAPDGVVSAGAQQAQNASGNSVYQFTGLTNAGDAQTITLSAVDPTGAQHTLNVNLNTTNAGTLDQALSTINSAIASSNDTTLEQIGAFKQEGPAGNTNGVEGISFMSAGGQFKVSLGASPAGSVSGVSAGIADPTSGASGGAVFTSAANGTGSTADISNIATATAAVSALATAVRSSARRRPLSVTAKTT